VDAQHATGAVDCIYRQPGPHRQSRTDMQPHSDALHCAKTNVRYALEVAQGGFAKRGITTGAQVTGLP